MRGLDAGATLVLIDGQRTAPSGATGLFADISTEMLYPILPVFLTQTLKASGSIVGLVDGFAQATQNVVQGFSGALSEGESSSG